MDGPFPTARSLQSETKKASGQTKVLPVSTESTKSLMNSEGNQEEKAGLAPMQASLALCFLHLLRLLSLSLYLCFFLGFTRVYT